MRRLAPFLAILVLLVCLGYTVNPTSFLIQNTTGHDSGVDLAIFDAANSGDVIGLYGKALSANPEGFISSFYSGTVGAYVEMGVNSSTGLVTAITCDSLDYPADALAGYCYVIAVNGTKGFAAPTLAYNVIYSVSGTAIPAAATGNNHAKACVSDANGCTNGSTYAGSHSTACEIYSNGSNWIETGIGC